MTRPSDAAIARAFMEREEIARRPGLVVVTHAAFCDLVNNRARAIDAEAEAKDVAGETGAVDPVVRYNDDGSLDEVVGTGEFHLEQMDHNYWWMRLGPHSLWLSAKGKIKASIGLNEQRVASAPTAVEGRS